MKQKLAANADTLYLDFDQASAFDWSSASSTASVHRELEVSEIKVPNWLPGQC